MGVCVCVRVCGLMGVCVRESEKENKRIKHGIDIKRKHTLVKGTTFPSIFLPRLRNYYD